VGGGEGWGGDVLEGVTLFSVVGTVSSLDQLSDGIGRHGLGLKDQVYNCLRGVRFIPQHS